MSPVYCYIPRCELQVSVDVYWWRCVLMEMCVCVCSSVSCVAVTTMKHSCCSVICVTVAITRTASRSRVSSYVWARVLHWLFDDYWCVGCIPVALMSSVCHVGCKCCFFWYSPSLTAFQMVTGTAMSAYPRYTHSLLLDDSVCFCAFCLSFCSMFSVASSEAWSTRHCSSSSSVPNLLQLYLKPAIHISWSK